MTNPFEILEARLSNIETLLLDIKHSHPTHDQPSSDDSLLTKKEVTKILGISIPTLDSYCEHGLLKKYKIGTRIRFRKEEIQEALKTHRPKFKKMP